MHIALQCLSSANTLAPSLSGASFRSVEPAAPSERTTTDVFSHSAIIGLRSDVRVFTVRRRKSDSTVAVGGMAAPGSSRLLKRIFTYSLYTSSKT